MFLLDANVLMAAADDHYPVDVAPGFWSQLREMLDEGQARIPFAVYREMTVHQQRWLTRWLAENVPQGCSAVLQEDGEQLQALGDLAQWLTDPERSFASHHVSRFLKGADPRLLAAAKVTGGSVVTYEEFISDPNVKKVKIPHVAQHLGIQCVKPVEMFRRLNRTM